MYEIPTSITIDGRIFQIRNNGDYRVLLDCFKALEDEELEASERLLASLIIFYEDFNSIEDVYNIDDLSKLVSEMFKFFNCGNESIGTKVNHSIIDWEQDSQLVCSAINKVANMEIRSEKYLHWWTFMGYYIAIGDSPLSTILGIRNKMLSNKKLEKYEQQFKRNNPQYFVWNSKSVSEKEADKIAKEIWNSGG